MSENTEMKKVPLKVPFAAEETKPYIFISYAHGDRERVFPIIKEIYEKGWHVWYDQGIEINKNYHNVIADHVLGCEVVVLFVSKTSVTREYVTDTEIAFALDEKKRIIFCELEEAELPSGIRSRTTDRERFPRTTVEGLCGVLEGIEGLTRVPEREAHGLVLNARSDGELILSSPEDEYEAEVTTENCIRLTKYKGNDENVVVPAKWKGLPVVELRGTFQHNKSIKSVMMPDSVTRICDSTFSGCRNLTAITIPDSVTSIGNFVFPGCSNLTAITIPDSVTSIGDMVFSGCSNLTAVTIPNRVTSIGWSAFDGCSRLISITIPDSVTSIGEGAFNRCNNVIIECEENSHAYQYTIKNKIPVRIVSIEKREPSANRTVSDKIPFVSDQEEPFVYCSYAHEDADKVFPIMKKLHDDGFSIRYDELDGKNSFVCAKEINSCAYFLAFLTPEYIEGDWLEELRLASPDKRVLYWLESCELPEDLRLQQGCIQGLRSWERTPEDIITIIEDMLIKGDCRGHYTPTIPGFDYRAEDSGITLIKYTGNSESVVIEPEYFGLPVTSIGYGAFFLCSNLTSITIPDSVTSIGDRAFSRCRSLATVTIPDSVASIGYDAFSRCYSLTAITLPDSVTSISHSAFNDCSSLTSVTIPDSVTSIGDGAFSNCSSLTSITIPGSVASIGGKAFHNCENLTVYCPENSCAWQYCEENNIPHKPLEDATAAESDTVSAPSAEVPAAEPEIIADAATEEATPEPAPTPTKSKTRRWLLPLILALALLAGGAAVQFTGLFDILGWLSGLLG